MDANEIAIAVIVGLAVLAGSMALMELFKRKD